MAAAPAKSGQLPAESEQLPAESGQLPSESGQQPLESGQLPIQSGRQLTGSEQCKEDISHRRKKKLTIAGQLLFEDTVNKRWAVLSKIKRKIDDEIQYFVESMNKKNIAIIVKENHTILVKMYKEKSCEFINLQVIKLDINSTQESKLEDMLMMFSSTKKTLYLMIK